MTWMVAINMVVFNVLVFGAVVGWLAIVTVLWVVHHSWGWRLVELRRLLVRGQHARVHTWLKTGRRHEESWVYRQVRIEGHRGRHEVKAA